MPVRDARFIFLGTGTSGGVPVIACDCRVCRSTDPRDRRTRTGAAVQWTDPRGVARTVLIDATPDLRQQALRHDLRRCDAILFTHNHVDHIFGLDEVRRFNAVMQAPIDIYGEGYVIDALHRVYKHVFDKEANVNDSFVATLIAHRLPPPPEDRRTPPAPLDLFGLRFTPLRLLHGRLPILGYRIDAPRGPSPPPAGSPFPLAYCTDVSAIPPQTWPLLEGLSTLVLDGLRHRRHPTHLTIDQAVSIADQIAARQTYFVHMAHEISHAEVDAGLPQGMNLAHDGLILGSAPSEGVSHPTESLTSGASDGVFEEG
ncbi:MAG: MBL fold metallo-hydrolase [Phycisphaerales bacterium]|nr:MBL fold metallo-hydrolase [Phycisphaerales bacterium]